MAAVREREETVVALRRLLPPHLIRVVVECAQLRLEVMLVCKQFYRLQWRYYDHKVRLSWAYLCALGKRSYCPALPTDVNWGTVVQYQSHDRERSPLGYPSPSCGMFMMDQVQNAVHQMLHDSHYHPALVAVDHGDVHMMKHFGSLGCLDGIDCDKMFALVARKGLVEAMAYLLEQGAYIDAIYSHEITALHWAAKTGDLMTVQWLLERGANIEAEDAYGRTALHYAVKIGPEEIVRCLVERGANLEAKDSGKRTPLHCVKRRDFVIVHYLLDRGGNIEAIDSREKTPLHRAAHLGDLPVVQCMLERGANVDATDQYDRTPLHLAVSANCLRVVRAMLGKGANMEVPDCDDRTALHYAAMGGYAEIVKDLLTRGADTSVLNYKGMSPLQEAERCGNCFVVQMFLDFNKAKLSQ